MTGAAFAVASTEGGNVRRTYACQLELADSSGRDPLIARALAKRWVGASYGGWPADIGEAWAPKAGVQIRWRSVEHEGSIAFELSWTRPHGTDPTLWRRTNVQLITSAAGDGRAVVIEGLESQDSKVRGQPAEHPEASELVLELVDSVQCVDGGWSVTGIPHRIDAERAPELDAFVRGDRHLPVVLVASDPAATLRADASGFARELAGLAHVVVLVDFAATTALTRELGPGRAVDPGAVRLVWPAWRSLDPHSRHPLWRAEDTAGPGGPRPQVLMALRAAVFDAAALRIDEDPAVAKLARAGSAHDLTRRRAELARLERAVADEGAAANELVDEYQSELQRADDDVFRLEAALEREHELRLRAENAYLVIATRAEEAGSAQPEVRTLLEAVRLAGTKLVHLVVLPEAERSARDWQYDRADLAWADLLRLDAIAADWDAGVLRADFASEARSRGLDWVRDISEDAQQKFGADYERRYRGEVVMLGPHVRRQGRQILRIYCYLDPVRHRVVVGHVGGHLGDRTV